MKSDSSLIRPEAVDTLVPRFDDSDAPLAIRLFGLVEITTQGRPVAALSRAALSLLALLVLRRGRPAERTALAEAIWPDAPPSRALFYLRRTLSTLREALGAEEYRLLRPSAAVLGLDLRGAFCDVAAFDDAVLRSDVAFLERAVALYRAPLLESWTAPWVLPEQERYRGRYVEALERLAWQRSEQGDQREAARLLHAALQAEPLRESVHCRLMEVLAQSGDAAGVEKQFHELRRVLRDERNTVPGPAARDIYQRSRRTTATPAAEPSAAAHPASPRPVVNLPCPLTTLIGRKTAVREAAEQTDTYRLTSLVGPGGVGKTRLSIAVAEERAGVYPEGVFFISLAPLLPEEPIAPLVAAALGLRTEARADVREALFAFLQLRRMLLVLDNCEHLIRTCGDFVNGVLKAAPFVHVLATSRQPLGIATEQVYPVPPLERPELPEAGIAADAATLAALRDCASSALFLERAAAASPSFRLTERNAPAVAEICGRMEGIPLAIELAAARLSQFTPNQIARRLDDRFRLLRQSRADDPRHRTLERTIDWSYRLLSEPQQILFRRLSVFSGGWSLTAAEAVCQGSGVARGEIAGLLHALVQHSLVSVDDGNDGVRRFGMLETLREYARQRLIESGESGRYDRRHTACFAWLIRRARPHLWTADAPAWIAELEDEQANVRLALDRASQDAKSAGRAAWMAAGLEQYWIALGRLQQGRTTMRSLLERQDEMTAPARCRALLVLGRIEVDLGSFTASAACYRRALRLARSVHAPGYEWKALRGLAHNAHNTSKNKRAYVLLMHALEVSRKAGDLMGVASVANGLGCIAKDRREWDAAEAYFDESLQIRRELRLSALVAITLFNKGEVLKRRGDVAAGARLFEESLCLSRELGHEDGFFVVIALGQAKTMLGEFATARTLLRQALDIARREASNDHISNANISLAATSIRAADLTAAREEMLAALESGRTTQDHRLIHHLLAVAGWLLVAAEDFEPGVVILSAAHQIDLIIGTMAGLSEQLNPWGAALTHAGTRLTEPTYKAAMSRGEQMTHDQALTYALATVSAICVSRDFRLNN